MKIKINNIYVRNLMHVNHQMKVIFKTEDISNLPNDVKK